LPISLFLGEKILTANTLIENEFVCLELTDEGIAHLQLARPDKLNSITEETVYALIEAGEALAELKQLRCVIVSGQGRAFCAGIDKSVVSGKTKPKIGLLERTHGDANPFQQVAMQFRKLPVPVITAIHGVCFGAGLAIASGADIRVAAPDARLSVMEMRWGLVPDMAMFVLFKGIVREDHLSLLTYTAKEFTGNEAKALGIVTELSDDPLAYAWSIARDVVIKNPDATRACKRLMQVSRVGTAKEILMAESEEQFAIAGSRNQMETAMSQLEGRPPEYV
jgi:enoyl-CoA hydratase/carnithine racemase